MDKKYFVIFSFTALVLTCLCLVNEKPEISVEKMPEEVSSVSSMPTTTIPEGSNTFSPAEEEAKKKYGAGRVNFLFGRGELDRDTKEAYFKNASVLFNGAKSEYLELYREAQSANDTQRMAEYEDAILKCKEKLEEVKKNAECIGRNCR